jgi:hypothetical protein
VPITNCPSTPSYTSNRVGSDFDITFSPCLPIVAANNFVIISLPFYDIGMINPENTISCSIGGVDSYCIPY